VDRRTALRTCGLVASGLLAGCLDGGADASDCTLPFEEVPPGNWPAYGRDPGNTGHAPVSTASIADRPTTVAAEDGVPLYKPIVVDGVLYARPAEDGNFPRAVDLSTGAALWQYERGSGLSMPAYADGHLVFVKSDEQLDTGTVYGVDAETGDERWAFDLGGPSRTTPVVADGTAYVTRDGDERSLVALDAATGEESWAAGGLRPVAEPAVAGGSVFVPDGERHVVALDAETGEDHWSREDDEGFDASGSPAVADGVVVVGDRGTVRAFGGCGGEAFWRFDARANTDGGAGLVSTLAVAGGTVYALVTSDRPSETGWAFALDLDTGERQWKTPVAYRGLGGLREPVVSDDAVVVPTSPDGAGEIVVLDREDGAVRRTLDVGGHSVAVDSHLLVSNADGVHGFELG